MLSEDIKQAIVKAGGLEWFSAGWHTMDSGRIFIGSIWVVEMNEWADPIYMAGIHQVVFSRLSSEDPEHDEHVVDFDNGWYKGVLLVPPGNEPLDRSFGGPDPLHAVDLEFPGHLYPLLKEADLLQEFDAPVAGNKYPCEIKVQIHVPKGTVYYQSNAHLPGKYQRRLWDGITRTLDEMSNAYDDDEITNYLWPKRKTPLV